MKINIRMVIYAAAVTVLLLIFCGYLYLVFPSPSGPPPSIPVCDVPAPLKCVKLLISDSAKSGVKLLNTKDEDERNFSRLIYIFFRR